MIVAATVSLLFATTLVLETVQKAKIGRKVTSTKRKSVNQRTWRAKARLHQQALLAEYAAKLSDGFPVKLLKIPAHENVGKTNTDYGGHALALNFPKQIVSYKYGRLSVGLMYESDHKKITHKGTETCKLSRTVLKDHLQDVLQSLRLCLPNKDKKSISDPVWGTLRVEFQRGNQTLQHNDACYGFTPNFVMFHDAQTNGGGLRIRLFPSLRCSVVRYNEKLYIPMQASEAKGTLKMYGLADDGIQTKKFLFPFNVLDDLVPYGNLDTELVVIGIKAGKLQYLNANHVDLVPTPKGLPLMNIKDAFQIAENNPVNAVKNTTSETGRRGPSKYKTFRKPHMWHKFWAWKHVHNYDGDRPTRRTHAYFRQIRLVPTASNYIRGDRKNYTDYTNSQLESIINLKSECFVMYPNFCMGCPMCSYEDHDYGDYPFVSEESEDDSVCV